ncbi:MAG: class I SAM-dependent methyltransferase [Acidimicrobiia bacterium]
MSRSLLNLFARLGSWPYDWMYRRGAPWESGPRPALVELCEAGRITVEQLHPGRAIDVGCGTGVDSLYLAEQGFDVVGVDFSEVAIGRAREVAADSARPPRFVIADLLQLPNEAIPGPFDLLFDGGTVDDFPPDQRPTAASAITRLARPGSVFVMWCFHARMSDLPRFSFQGPSRWGAPPIEPGEETALFGDQWRIETFGPIDQGSACFVMVKD